MLFKSTFLLGLAALAVADNASPATDRMVKIKRAQDAIAADAAMAKRSAPAAAENLARRSGANRMDKRHHGDAGAHADMAKRATEAAVDKRDLPLFQGLLSLLNQVYPGLNTAVFGTEVLLNGAVNGLDQTLKKRGVELSENQKRELPLFQGLLSLLNQVYPGLNTAVYGVETTLNGAVNGLDQTLRERDLNAAPVNEKRDLPLFQGLLSLLNQVYPGLNTAVFGVENVLNGAVNGLDQTLKKRAAGEELSEVEKRDLSLFQGLLSTLNQIYPGLNTAVFGVENVANGAVNGLDGILKKRGDLPLFQGLLSLLNQVYPGLNTAVFGVENVLNGAVNGLDQTLKKRTAGEELTEVEKRDLSLFQGLLSTLNQIYPGLNTAVFGTEVLLNGAVNGLDQTLKKRKTVTANVKVDLEPVVDSLLNGGLDVSDLSSGQLSQLRGLTSLLNLNQLNSYLGSSLTGAQFSQLQGLLGVTVNSLLGGILSGGLLSGLGGSSGGNLLGGLLGGLGRE
ncbi:hypothetical protein JCM6882_000615 [Rhodosporidiobolus microsporus]